MDNVIFRVIMLFFAIIFSPLLFHKTSKTKRDEQMSDIEHHRSNHVVGTFTVGGNPADDESARR